MDNSNKPQYSKRRELFATIMAGLVVLVVLILLIWLISEGGILAPILFVIMIPWIGQILKEGGNVK